MLVVTQPTVLPVAERVLRTVDAATICELADGEAAKTVESLESVYAALDSAGIRRDGTVVAIGGGSLTDVAGFAAATWLRGIESVYVPTTLLGAVDASIGGKTGINFRGKNLVGAFWHPSRVIIDIALLEQLPEAIAREGWAEIIKAGLLADRDLVDAIARSGTQTDLERAVTAAVRVKARVVAADFREAGARAHLNLGHTIGHAIEAATGLSHGDSVALGLVAEAAASRVDRGFSEEALVRHLVSSAGLPTEAPSLDKQAAVQFMAKDKKSDVRGIHMVMLDDLQHPVLVRPSADAMEAAWAAIGL